MLFRSVKTVSAFSKTLFHNIEAEDAVSAAFEFVDGGIGVLSASTCSCPGNERRLEICGSDGRLILLEDKIISLYTKSGIQLDNAIIPEKSDAAKSFAEELELHKLQIGDFVNSILQNKPSDISGTSAASALRFAFAVYASAQSRSYVNISDICAIQ